MDIQALFEQHSVPELQTKLEQIRRDIEKEKEELRIMVSERYRDLIEAADSIVDMQRCAQQICQHVHNIETGCSRLKHEGLIGFRGRDQEDIARQERKRRVYDTGARVKLLMDMPETLWKRVERGEMLTAALLHMLAQYIYTGLQVAGQSVRRQFPVVLRQWTAVQRLRDTILSGCHAAVRDADLQQTERVEGALVAAALLEGSGARSALGRLLRERAAAAQMALRADDVQDSVGRQAARAARIVLHTLQLVHALFCGETEAGGGGGESEGRFSSRLQSAAGSQRPFDLVEERGSLAMRHLSADIRNYTPAVASSEQRLTPAEVRQLVSSWLQQLQEQLKPKVTALLESVPTIRGLASVRDGVYTLLLEDQHRPPWPEVCQTTAGTEVSLWERLLREAVTARAERHIRRSLDAAFTELSESLAEAVQQRHQVQSTLDIVDFRWTDASELPSGGGWLNYRQRRQQQQAVPGLALRSRGHAPAVQRLCAALDGHLAALVADVNAYTERPEPLPRGGATGGGGGGGAAPFDRWADNEAVAAALRDGTQRQLTGLLATLERLASVPGAVDGAAVLLARVSRGITDLCPHLALCLDNSTCKGSAVPARCRLWEELSGQLVELRPRLLTAWGASLAAELAADVADALRQAGDTRLDDFALWAAVAITEEGEAGQQVESTIHVPRAPRLSLTDALYRLSTRLSRLGSLTLGRGVQSQLVQQCVRELVDVYARHLAAPSAAHSGAAQRQALQSLFDLHLLKSLASARDQELSAKMATVCEQVEENIDPFDLNVCWPHALKNLRTFTQQTHSLLGALTVERGPSRPLSAAAAQQEPPCLLPLVGRPPRFSLLAVPDAAPLERPRPPTAAKTTPAATTAAKKSAETIKPSPSFLAGLSASWF